MAEQEQSTVAFVQEWMMSGDHEPDQWHRDFAAAIDARTPTPDAVNADKALAWLSMDCAPKNGTILELVVDYTGGSGPLQDGILACTIGWNSLDHTGEDEWTFAGWDWSQDYLRAGAGEPIAWRPSRLNATDDGLGPLPPRPVKKPLADGENT